MGNSIGEVAESLVGFMPQFNDKILSLFPPSPEVAKVFSKSQVRVLMLLRKRSGQTATELGEGLGMTKASLTGILDELESKGLARRTADPEDRRKLRVGLSGPGKKAADSIARALEGALGERIAPLSAEDRRALARHLGALTIILAKL
jgi:DNA-binding MarR family transcriptional regulator